MAAIQRAVKRTCLYLAVMLICVCMLTPVYILAKTSLSTPAEVLTQHPTFIIKELDFSHWQKIFASGKLWPPFIRSLSVATATTLAAMLLVVPAAYTISRFSRKWRYACVMLLFFTRMIPNVALALPVSVRFLKWNLLDSMVGLVLANLINQIPFMAWILVSTFEGIPVEMDEASAIDGAGKLRCLWSVILPVAKQGIAVAAMYVWLNAWNEFTYAVYLSNNTKTMPLQIYYYVERGGFFEQAAYAAILTIPVIIITFVLQRYLKADYLSGAVKG